MRAGANQHVYLSFNIFSEDSHIETHREIFQVGRDNICSHLTPFDYITAIFGVSAHGSGPGALVIAAIDLFSREG